MDIPAPAAKNITGSRGGFQNDLCAGVIDLRIIEIGIYATIMTDHLARAEHIYRQ